MDLDFANEIAVFETSQHFCKICSQELIKEEYLGASINAVKTKA